MHKLESLNSLRGLAALMVALDHSILYAARVPKDGALWHWATFMGSFGVGAFFLLSGFVIFLSLEKTSPSRFLLQRVFRLYPVIIAAVALRLAVQLAFGLKDYGEHTLQTYLLNVSLFGNLFLLIEQNIEPIVWTLSIEVKFYLLMALLFTLAGTRFAQRAFWQLAAVAVLLAVCGLRYKAWAATPGFATAPAVDLQLAICCLPALFLGTVFCLAYRRTLPRGRIYVLAGLFVFAYTCVPVDDFVSLEKTGTAWILATIAFAACLYSRNVQALLDRPWLAWLGAISYPLYAIHGAVIDLVVHTAPHASPSALLLRAVVVSLGCAWLLHRWVEAPIHDWSRTRFSGGPRQPQAAT